MNNLVTLPRLFPGPDNTAIVRSFSVVLDLIAGFGPVPINGPDGLFDGTTMPIGGQDMVFVIPFQDFVSLYHSKMSGLTAPSPAEISALLRR